MNQIKFIRFDKLKPPEFDARLTTDQEADDELRDSIKELGILEPLLVKDTVNGYEVIAGNRRMTQGIRAGLAAAPCIVEKVSGAESDKIKLHENTKRLDLSPVDQAYTFAYLIKEYKLTELQVSLMVHKSTAYVSQHLALLQCDDGFIDSVATGQICFSTARELMQCKDLDERKKLQSFVENNGATGDVVRGWVQESNRETESFTPPDEKEYPIQRETESQVPMYPCGACNTPVSLVKIKTVRLCPDCHYLIFSEIEHEKFKLRKDSAIKA